MQTTLLGLAIAIILALVTALVAPLVIDWNHYRGTIEAEASRLAGFEVRVNGPIEARLLPSPVITLGNVDVGQAGHAPALRAGTLRFELALGPLLRGQIQASEARLIAPQISLGLDSSGAADLPTVSPSFRPEAFSISHLNVEDGRVTLTDAQSGGRLVLQKVWFSGDIRSFAGPFGGEGAAVVDDALYGYRISGSPADNGGTNVRLSIDPSDRPLTSDLAGRLTFERGVPRFEGTLALARPVGATLANGQRVVSEPWRATGAIKLTPASAALSELNFRYGPEERSLTFTGNADLHFGAHPDLAGNVSALQLDVDRALAAPDITDRPPLVVVRSFMQSFVAAAKLPIPVRLGVRIDALTIGGTTIESLHGELDGDRSGWSLRDFQFHAPGMSEVTLGGRLADGPQGFAFNGPVSLQSEDLNALLAWLSGRAGGGLGVEARTLSANGNLTLAADRVAVEGLAAKLDRDNLDGRLAYTWPAGGRPARLDAELRAQAVNLDTLSSFGKLALGPDGFSLPQEAALSLDIRRATFAGVDAQAVNAQVKYDSGQLQIDRLSVGNLAGAKIDVSGRIDELSSQPRGSLTFDLDARALDGLSEVVAKLAPIPSEALHRATARLAPAKLHAVLNVQRAAATGSTAELHVNGNLATLRLVADGSATGETAHLESANVHLDERLDADDGTVLTALLGLDGVLAVDQLPGRLTLSADGPMDGDIRVAGKVSASGFASALAGILRLTGSQTPAARLHLQANAGDLRPLNQVLTGQPGSAVPVSARATLAIDGPTLSFTDVAATIGSTSAQARLTVRLADPVAIDGQVEAGAVDGSALLATLLGLPPSGQGNANSAEKIGAGAFAARTGAVAFTLHQAALTPTLAAHELSGVVHLQPGAISLDSLNGTLAEGRIGGALAFQRNPDGLGVHANLQLTDSAAASVIGPAFKTTGGSLRLDLQGDGFGATRAGLVGSLHGTGTVTLKDVYFAGLDAGVFDVAMQAAGLSAPVDLAKVEAAVNAALANGHLAISEAAVPVTITAGAIRFDHVVMPAAGSSELSSEGSLDLGSGAIEARITVSESPPPNALIAVRPEYSVGVKGPFTAPTRSLDISPLMSWLTLRAAELQTRRIESIEANQRAGAAGEAPHPASPDMRAMPPGAVVESAAPPEVMTAPGPGARGLERLEPESGGPQPSPSDPIPPNGGADKGAITLPGPLVIRPNERRMAPQKTPAASNLPRVE